ncbi:MAG: sensor histidine kinase [Synechococcus sp.]|nr:sensor histidine kinase [Synechococcus sp.]
MALSDQAARADLTRLRRGLLLGGVVTVLAAVPPELRRQPTLAWSELDGLSRRMGELLDDLLLLARQEQSGMEGPLAMAELQEFDLLELLEDLLRCHAPQAGVRSVRLQLSPDPATHCVPFRGQSEPLLRLFTNLLLNAIRHCPEGGTVSLQVSRASRLIRVTVAVQSPGIPLLDREQVFERFWSDSDRGGESVLGLAIGRAIARRHGGELRIGESRAGRCELVVELPAMDAP